MLDLLYRWIFYHIQYPQKIHAMNVIAFYLSAKKHIRRKSPRWMVVAQVSGMWMCFKQLWKEA